jgi:hypothetical protein
MIGSSSHVSLEPQVRNVFDASAVEGACCSRSLSVARSSASCPRFRRHSGRRCNPRVLRKGGYPYKGNLRVRDASQGEQCRIYENQLDWNQTGPTGATGATGPAAQRAQQAQQDRLDHQAARPPALLLHCTPPLTLTQRICYQACSPRPTASICACACRASARRRRCSRTSSSTALSPRTRKTGTGERPSCPVPLHRWTGNHVTNLERTRNTGATHPTDKHRAPPAHLPGLTRGGEKPDRQPGQRDALEASSIGSATGGGARFGNEPPAHCPRVSCGASPAPGLTAQTRCE